MNRTGLLCLTLIFLQASAYAQEYSFDLGAFEKKPLKIGGYFEYKYTDQSLNKNSALSQTGDASDYVQTGVVEMNGDYSWGNSRLSGTLHGLWLDDDFGEFHDTTFYEAYFNHRFSDRLSVDIGKRAMRWGKGYAWNPVGFIERPKDPLDPDLSREGFSIASADFVRSFDGDLQTMAFTSVYLPVRDDLNEDYGERGDNFAAKLYLLYRDIDIDLLYRNNSSRPARLGIDFSTNLLTNFEIHGEWSHGKYSQKVLSGSQLNTKNGTSDNLLLGLRYLTEQDTTYILEYYHNDEGYSDDQMRDFYRYIASASVTPSQAKKVARSGYTSRQNMRDYLYLRINQKEPFDILYLTPGLTLIYNLHDKSYSFSPDIVYTGVDNLELRLRATLLNGGRNTEFGEKLAEGKIELRVRYTF